MNNANSLSFTERLFQRTGAYYPHLVYVCMQIVNTPLTFLLVALTTQHSAELSKTQGIGLLVFASAAMILKSCVLSAQFYFFNWEMFLILTNRRRVGGKVIEKTLEKRAWEQATCATWKILFFEAIEYIFLVLIPTLVYGHYALGLSFPQEVYLTLSAIGVGLINLIMENLTLDQWFTPVLEALKPRKFEDQLSGLTGAPLRVKLSIAILGLVLISLLLVVPTAYHQLKLFSEDIMLSSELVGDALPWIVKMSLIAVVVGSLISMQMVSYILTPIRKMVKLFSDIEKGDLSQRIEIIFPDEFGKLNIYLNNMIHKIQNLNSNLEYQVAERTAQLKLTNEQLEKELLERKRTEDQLAYSALHDPLTGLPNRALFLDRLRHAMERAKRHKNYTYAVFFMDLDRFKVVNDSLGHNIGDSLLIESGHRLETCVRSEDTVARFGGDEFVILLEEFDAPTDYINVAERVQQELALPANLDGQMVFVSVSTGIVLSTNQYEKPEDVLRDADIAMYRAKRCGRGRYEVFDSSMLDGVITRLEMENDLRKALNNKEFIVHYQPIVKMETSQIVGFEALLRWQHPKRGMIQPTEFISILEEMGLIVPVGYWVLDQACHQIRSWQQQFPVDPSLTVNVNLSARQCAEKDLVEKVAAILEKNSLNANSLKLELTESLVFDDAESASDILLRLRELGVQVQIDDFGTGYSSLSYLNTLPIDALKIDRTFINQLGIGGSEIVQSILTLAHSLGMQVIAEGVETTDQRSQLLAMHCEFVQGYLYARPVDDAGASDLLGKSFPNK